MEIKILQVFFDSNGLPYKDKERTIHFPIIGSGFQGASNTTKIRFYYGELGDSATSWVATSKLPNGKIGSKVLSTYLDTDLDESYALLELSSFYFQYKGDVFISLQGYEGGVQVEYDSVHEIYKIVGTPTIQATGSIKLSVNYATQFVGSGEENNADLQSMLALLGEKANDDEVVHKAGAETITGAKTFSGTTTFSGSVYNSGATYFTNHTVINNFGGAGGYLDLAYSYLTTNSKTYFARVGVTSNQYVYYDLPKNYNDLGSQQHLTLATENYVDDAITSYLGSVIKLQPSKTVAQLNALTLDSSMVGYVYNVTTSGTLTAGNVDVVAGDNVIVIDDNGSYIFDKFAESVDLSNYYDKEEVNGFLDDKLDKSTSASKLYGTDSDGEQTTYSVGDFATTSDLSSGLALKEDLSNKVTSLSGSSTDTQYPSAKCVYDITQDIREVAEGKCKTYTVSISQNGVQESDFVDDYKVYTTTGEEIDNWADFQSYVENTSIGNADLNSQNLSVEISQCYLMTMDGIIILSSDDPGLKDGDIILVLETNVPDRWVQTGVTSTYLNELETALANYVTLNSAQTITGEKTFSNGISFGNASLSLSGYNLLLNVPYGDLIVSSKLRPQANNSYDIGSSSYAWKDLYLAGKFINGNISIGKDSYSRLYITINSNTNYYIGETSCYLPHVYPSSNNSFDLGQTSYKWRNIYLAGNLTDGTESYNIQDSYNLLFGKYTENNAMTELDYTQYCIIQLSSNRTFTLKSAPYGCFPEYHFKVENTSSSAITLTFPNNTVILTNDEDNVVVSSNTISLAGNTTIECSLVGLNLVAINFEVQ